MVLGRLVKDEDSGPDCKPAPAVSSAKSRSEVREGRSITIRTETNGVAGKPFHAVGVPLPTVIITAKRCELHPCKDGNSLKVNKFKEQTVEDGWGPTFGYCRLRLFLR